MAPTLAQRPLVRLAVLCALYLTQGIPYGFISVTLAAYLTKGGADAAEVGALLAVTLLPWSFKFLWAPAVDLFQGSAMGRRRPWLLAAQTAMIGTALAVAALGDPRHQLGWLTILVFAHSAFAALQDVAADALAVDLLPESERGRANGLMYAASYLGIMIGGAQLSRVVEDHGFLMAVGIEVGFLAAVALLPLLLLERQGDRLLSLARRERSARGLGSAFAAMARDLGRGFSRGSAAFAALLAVTVHLGLGVLSVVGMSLLLGPLGWTQAQYGQLLAGWPLLFGLAGAAVGGVIADALGHKKTVALASVLTGLSWIVFGSADAWWSDRDFILVMACGENLLIGVMTAALFALFMGVASKAVAATQFSAFMALLNLGRSLGHSQASSIDEAVGTAGAYIVMGALQMAVIAWLLLIRPGQGGEAATENR